MTDFSKSFRREVIERGKVRTQLTAGRSFPEFAFAYAQPQACVRNAAVISFGATRKDE